MKYATHFTGQAWPAIHAMPFGQYSQYYGQVKFMKQHIFREATA